MNDRSRDLKPNDSSPLQTPASWNKRLVAAWRRLWRNDGKEEEKWDRRSEKFRMRYELFREILSLNDSMLQLIADIEDKLLGRAPFALEPLTYRVRSAMFDMFVMVKNLNQIENGRYRKLYDTLGRINSEIDVLCNLRPQIAEGPLTIMMDELRASSASQAGVKMATLGEIRASLGYRVPNGFVVTTFAFGKLVNDNDLWDKVSKLKGILEIYGPPALEKACREVLADFHRIEPPPAVAQAILDAYDALWPQRDVLVAMRSSGVAEDGNWSHAGQYYSELSVSHDLLLESYLEVAASAFRSNAVTYRYNRGLTEDEALMAVGCIEMIDSRTSGIMFSRQFEDPSADRVVITATKGLADALAAGRQNAEEVRVTPGELAAVHSTLLAEEEIGRLIEAARRLEDYFGSPQDIEWAIDQNGELIILQSRRMVDAQEALATAPEITLTGEPIISGGQTACPGARSGPVYQIRSDIEIDRFPEGAVLVARNSSAKFSRLMSKCAAIVTDVGTSTGHMAILAREFGVPTIVGLADATSVLEQNRIVTVDATSRRIWDGAAAIPESKALARSRLADSQAARRLRGIAKLVSPLHLTDPTSADFKPSKCRSLHDITRFVHEKVYEAMFRISDLASRDRVHSLKLDAHLPLDIRVFDIGGGLAMRTPESKDVTPGEVRSEPLVAFLQGLLDPRIRWDRPRNVSARGFLSVLGESMAGPPPEVRGVGSTSYIVLSDRYMNFSTKAGYHFSTVDTYCGKIQNKNYIHFHFAGGGATEDRRSRRVRFLAAVLSHLGFHVPARGDLLTARLDKYDRDYTLKTLIQLGRLTMCARQLDMLMDSDAAADAFAGAFIREEFERF
ncbi:MAG: hypothetical protein JXA30_12475 [Deltaproteobacteria bacterium]|nr:hypothetical protein [Deltaproteobacteria bacterium]